MSSAVFQALARMVECLSTTSSGSEHAHFRTNFPHNTIDVAHVAPAKIDAKYIAVNCSCILLNSGSICHISTQESHELKKKVLLY